MSFTNWIKEIFADGPKDNKGNKTIFTTRYQAVAQKLNIEKFVICSAINLIAGAISKCEFRTFLDGKEVFGYEYYLWNVEPNANQNSSQFLQELISRLLYMNECLVVEMNGKLMIAEDFFQKEYALCENYFEQVSRCGFQFNKVFPMADVLYFKLNNENINNLLTGFCHEYGELMSAASDKYQKNGGEKGILTIDSMARGDKNFEKNFESLMNDRFRKYFENRNAVLPLFDGYQYESQSGERYTGAANEISDIRNLTDQVIEKVAQAFKIPAALLKGDIADIEALTQNFLTFCIDPLADIITEEINRKRYGKAVLKGNYVMLDTTCIEHLNIFGLSEKVDKLISDRIYNPNEIRRKFGEPQIQQPWADEYTMTKNLENVGGE